LRPACWRHGHFDTKITKGTKNTKALNRHQLCLVVFENVEALLGVLGDLCGLGD
jgi:hypothetical protein